MLKYRSTVGGYLLINNYNNFIKRFKASGLYLGYVTYKEHVKNNSVITARKTNIYLP